MAGKKIPIAALPEGAVTLLLADLEGSTTAWETAPEIGPHDDARMAGIPRHGKIRDVI